MPFTDPVVAGEELVTESIHSPGYESGVSGWSINRDGTSEFGDATVRGELTAGPATARVTANASGVSVTDETTGESASLSDKVLKIQPATPSGDVISPAIVSAEVPSILFNRASVTINSPNYTALGTAAGITLVSGDNVNAIPSEAQINGDLVTIGPSSGSVEIPGKLAINGSVTQSGLLALTRVAAQSVPHNSPTNIAWSAREYGDASLWDTTINGIIATYTGYHDVSGFFTIASSAASTARLIGISLNGVLDTYARNRNPAVTATIEMSIHDGMFYAVAGDVIGIMAYHNAGVGIPLNVTNARMSARLVHRTV